MYHCPECHAEVPAKANFCQKCGYNAISTRMETAAPSVEEPPRLPNTSQLPPDTPPTVPAMPPKPPLPTRTVKPAMKHMPAGSLFANRPSQIAQSALESSPERASEGKKPAVPASKTGKQSHPPGTPVGLIRPIGATPSRPSTTATTPARSDRKASIPPPVTPSPPAHLLALQPLTPIVPALPTSRQFLRPAFLPFKTRESDTADIFEQQTRPEASLDNFESYIATSKAAEHWRTSWRDRQGSEARAAVSISRGQSPVHEPLIEERRDSPVRIQAPLAPVTKQIEQGKKSKGLGFWLTFFLMICLIGGLGAYILFPPLFHAETTVPADAHVSTSTPGPRLSIERSRVKDVLRGQILILHGEYFAAGAPIIFLLDTATIINDPNGLEISLQASEQGTFDVEMPTSTWSVGKHRISAEDNRSGQSASLNIQVRPR